MRILHLISSLGLFGAEQVLLNLASDPQVTAYVGALENQHNPHLEIIEEAKKKTLPVACFQCTGKFDLVTVFRLKKYLLDQKIDIVHSHNYKSNLFGLLAARLAGIKIVATAHGFTDINRKVSFYEKLDRFILRFFDKVVVVSDSVLPNFSLAKKVVIPNGIDIARFSVTGDQRLEIRATFGLSGSDFVIGTVGRLSPEKNQKLLIRGAGALVAGHPNLKLLIVGDGELRKELEGLAGNLGLWDAGSQANAGSPGLWGAGAPSGNNVFFAGLRPDVPAMYSVMDIFVLPSLTEGVPLTILEAMAAKVPVVATRVGGIPHLIRNQDNGVLIASGAQGELEQAIARLINQPDLRSRLAEQAYKDVCANFSVERMCSNYIAIYRDLLAS